MNTMSLGAEITLFSPENAPDEWSHLIPAMPIMALMQEVLRGVCNFENNEIVSFIISAILNVIAYYFIGIIISKIKNAFFTKRI